MGLLEKSSNDQDAHLILENQKHSLPSFRFWSIMPLSWNFYHPIHRFSVNNMVESWLTKTILLNWRKRGVYSWNSTIWSPHLAISIYTLHTILCILKIQGLDIYFFYNPNKGIFLPDLIWISKKYPKRKWQFCPAPTPEEPAQDEFGFEFFQVENLPPTWPIYIPNYC
jgi:hypothetical protein